MQKRTVKQEKRNHPPAVSIRGAMVEVEATSTAKDCPYCGTPFVLADKQIAAIRPDGVVPFQIDKNKVGDCFANG